MLITDLEILFPDMLVGMQNKDLRKQGFNE